MKGKDINDETGSSPLWKGNDNNDETYMANLMKGKDINDETVMGYLTRQLWGTLTKATTPIRKLPGETW